MKLAPRILARAEIEKAIQSVDLIALIADGFVAYSSGRVLVPPIGELLFPERHGEVHIKYGATHGDWCYVVKIASGFYDNDAVGVPSTDGLVLVFSQYTGELLALLLDEGYLTNLRTAVAGAVVARHLAPPEVKRIGVIGTGAQARLQAHWLKRVMPCRHVLLWGRSRKRAEECAEDLAADEFTVEILAEPNEVVAASELVVTTTAAEEPLIDVTAIHPRLHITAMGSDTTRKQELDAQILGHAHVIADSRVQCRERGEIAHALRAGVLQEEKVAELGEVISGRRPGRTRPEDITVADLTGVAVQDIQIAKAVIMSVAPDLVRARG